MSGRYSAPAHLSPVAAEVWDDIVGESDTPQLLVGDELAAFCNAVALERDCARRVSAEGVIVSDERGRPIPHPAIAVQRQAQQDIKNWAEKFQ